MEYGTHHLGRRGEELAARYLRAAGYTIAAANFRNGRYEIDLIVRRGRELVAVEVKTRRRNAASAAADHLAPRQVRHIKRALASYCRAHHLPLASARLDLIVILGDPERGIADLRHYPRV